MREGIYHSKVANLNSISYGEGSISKRNTLTMLKRSLLAILVCLSATSAHAQGLMPLNIPTLECTLCKLPPSGPTAQVPQAQAVPAQIQAQPQPPRNTSPNALLKCIEGLLYREVNIHGRSGWELVLRDGRPVPCNDKRCWIPEGCNNNGGR